MELQDLMETYKKEEMSGHFSDYDVEMIARRHALALLSDRETKIRQRVHLLRQWLNEDRQSRLVTSEELLTWLEL